MQVGLIVIAMRQHGPHIAKILARQAIGEAQHLHHRAGVIGFDIAGPERGNPPRLFRSAYEIARAGGLGLTAHAGEDSAPDYVWEAIDVLGATRIGHGCAATELMRRLARDRLVVECCMSSNYHTGAVARGAPHPIVAFLGAGVPVAICCDNTTVSRTDQIRESLRAVEQVGIEAVEAIHQTAGRYSFIRTVPGTVKNVKGPGAGQHS
jgi:adenosine deaminase